MADSQFDEVKIVVHYTTGGIGYSGVMIRWLAEWELVNEINPSGHFRGRRIISAIIFTVRKV